MRIYFNGDSNVAGTELDNPTHDGMAYQLARRFDNANGNNKFLNANIINDSKPGAGNDRIYDTTLNYLSNFQKPDLVIIGWTDFSRIQWFLDEQFYEINHIGVHIDLPDEYQSRYQHWKDNVQRSGMWNVVMSEYWHNKIYNLHSILNYRKIPHLFFNAFDYFKIDSKYQSSWNNCYLDPYSNNLVYTKYCESKGYPEITPGWHHYPPEAHKHWADLMYNHIKQNNIL